MSQNPSKTQLFLAASALVEAVLQKADEEMSEKLAGIVKLHAGLAVGSAFIPIPGADMVAAATNIWTMYIRINKEIGLPFKENVIKSIASGVVTNLGSAIAGVLVVGTVAKLFPGLGSLGGGAVIAATIYGVTVTAGILYMKAVAKLYDAQHGANSAQTKKNQAEEEERLRRTITELMKDKEKVKKIINDSKKGYKPDDK